MDVLDGIPFSLDVPKTFTEKLVSIVERQDMEARERCDQCTWRDLAL
jgi:hypothetical protein